MKPNTEKFILVLGLLLALGCATKEKKVCPTEAEEPVSSCRAEEQCKYQSAATSVGVGMGFGSGVALGIGTSRPIGEYSRCYHDAMDEQEKKSKQVK